MGGRQSTAALRHAKNDPSDNVLLGSPVPYKNGSALNFSSRHDKTEFASTTGVTSVNNIGYVQLECTIYHNADMLSPVGY